MTRVIRLQKYLAECGVASRRASEGLILAGRVQVNGAVAAIGCSIDPETDTVAVDGRPLAKDEKVYIVLNKPAGSVTTANDTHGRKTVLDCVRGAKARVFPVGRLDMDVEGVLLLTNDGELAHRLIHPSFEVEKVYHAWVRGIFNETAAARLEKGVLLEDGMTAPARVQILKQSKNSTLIELTLHEGRKREVKRMCAEVGHPVRILQRVAFGELRANGLRPGEWRYLSAGEISMLRRRAGLAAVAATAS
jgi:23S rRNA pseudouridine2605 synthase